MKAFDQYSRIVSTIDFLDTSAFDVANQCGSQETSTQKSCITILSSQESNENMIGEYDIGATLNYICYD
jgi:exonuclease-1